jgi:hypothetical protein
MIKKFTLFLCALCSLTALAQTKAEQSYKTNGDKLLFVIGKAYNSIEMQHFFKLLEDSAYYSFDGAKPRHSYDIPSKGIGLDFNINFTLSSIRLYDDGFSKLKYPWDLPINLYWEQSIDSVFFGFNAARIDSTNPFKLLLKWEYLSGEAYFKDNGLNLLRITANNDFLLESDRENIKLWGVRVMPNGEKIEGDCLEGYGEMKWPNEGALYKGLWYYGMPEGQGNLKLETGLTYSGEFLSGFFWGKGTLDYPGNIQYTGDFSMGLRNGKGTATFSDGSTYSGDWVNNMMEGNGTYSFGRQYKYKGEFKANKFEGQGVLMTPEGEHKGEFKNSKPHGPGSMTSSRSGNRLKGNWVNGKKEGDFLLIRSDGTEEKVKFSRDIEIR